MQVGGGWGNAIETDPGRSRQPRMCLNGHRQQKELRAVSKSPTTSLLFGSSGVSETGFIQKKGLHERDAGFQCLVFFFFLCNWNNKEPDFSSCSSHQNRVTVLTAEAGEIFSSNLCVLRKQSLKQSMRKSEYCLKTQGSVMGWTWTGIKSLLLRYCMKGLSNFVNKASGNFSYSFELMPACRVIELKKLKSPFFIVEELTSNACSTTGLWGGHWVLV